jgi:hypothetical protein
LHSNDHYYVYRHGSTEKRAWAAEANIKDFLSSNPDIADTIKAGNELSSDQAGRIKDDLVPTLYDINVTFSFRLANGQLQVLVTRKK